MYNSKINNYECNMLYVLLYYILYAIILYHSIGIDIIYTYLHHMCVRQINQI